MTTLKFLSYNVLCGTALAFCFVFLFVHLMTYISEDGSKFNEYLPIWFSHAECIFSYM